MYSIEQPLHQDGVILYQFYISRLYLSSKLQTHFLIAWSTVPLKWVIGNLMCHVQNQTLDLLCGHQSIHPQSSPSQAKTLRATLISLFSPTYIKLSATMSILPSKSIRIWPCRTMSELWLWNKPSELLFLKISALATLCFCHGSFHSVYLHGSKSDFWIKSLRPFSKPSSEFLSHLHYTFNLL